MFFYRLICLILFIIVMSTLGHFMIDTGHWGEGFAVGTVVGGFGGLLAGMIERREGRGLKMPR